MMDDDDHHHHHHHHHHRHDGDDNVDVAMDEDAGDGDRDGHGLRAGDDGGLMSCMRSVKHLDSFSAHRAGLHLAFNLV